MLILLTLFNLKAFSPDFSFITFIQDCTIYIVALLMTVTFV